MATLEVPGANLNYEVWRQGGGESRGWITLINGHTRPLNDFRMLGKKLVERGFEVLAFDNRGAGLTTVSDGFSLLDMTGDVRSLWKAEGIDKTHLMGISMGGFLCQQLVTESRAKINKMILVSTAARHDGIARDERPWSTDIEQTAAKLSSYFTANFAEKNAALVKSMAKQIATQVEKSAFVSNSQLQRRALDGFDLRSVLPSFDIPTLIIHGEEDAIIPAGEGEALAKLIKKSQLVKIPSVGHLLLAEAPAKLYDLVFNFFS
jgi:3-oxoadipate enol-lactonase